MKDLVTYMSNVRQLYTNTSPTDCPLGCTLAPPGEYD